MTNITAILVFDSWLDSSPERRSRKPEDRHLIYECGGIILDLLMKQSGEDRIHVAGQILFADSATGSLSGVIAQMNCGGQLFETHPNALGEFCFQSVPRLSLELCIMLPSRRVCVRCLTLDELQLWQVVPMMAAGSAL